MLDKIILYLRIVHSVDYYNHCEYPNEDEMPNRCGILHARGPAPLTQVCVIFFMFYNIMKYFIRINLILKITDRYNRIYRQCN